MLSYGDRQLYVEGGYDVPYGSEVAVAKIKMA